MESEREVTGCLLDLGRAQLGWGQQYPQEEGGPAPL